MKTGLKLLSILIGIIACYLLLSSFQLERGSTQDLYRIIGGISILISSLLFSISRKRS
ncbi:putative membrane protein [Streptococcus rupicaprae]|uniref:Membrane protein n=1 Tax=Streptococcus rupicaprae TaxID=759619 RepID=A0ABV2FFQ6_9STRE